LKLWIARDLTENGIMFEIYYNRQPKKVYEQRGNGTGYRV